MRPDSSRVVLMAGILALALGAPGSASQAAESSSLKLSGSIRIRQESLDGQYRPGFDDKDDMLALRSSVMAEWTQGDWKLVGELSDSRAYDTDSGSVLTANEVNALEPVQAYVRRDFVSPFGKGSSATVQVGRMLVNLGSRRLVASDEFRNTPQGSTGIRTDLRFANKAQWVAFYLMPQQRRPDDFASLRDNEIALDHEGGDLRLWGMMAARPGLLPGDTLGEITYVRLQEDDHGARATRNRNLHTISVRAIRDPKAGQGDFEIEGIVQSGHIRASTAANATTLDVNAWFLHADAGYTFQTTGRPRLSAEFDYVSGDGPSASYQRFDTLFGMRRPDLAPSGIYGAVGRANLQSLGLRLEAAPSARVDVLGTYRLLWAADRHDSFSTSGIRDASGASGSFAGQQLDGRVRYWIVPQKLRAEVNAVWLLRGGLLRNAPNASPHGDTHYLSAALTLTY
ncbi:MAG: alginate export family protein [Steroidobacteraceae bacterium]